jgi:NADPH-dependent 2,4-dienoyl-CoA reductase/sulfur reductase-like enzyme
MADTAYRYLIVGGGMAGDAAARGIREVDGDGPIGIVGGEPHTPYRRPPLSKDLWKGGDEAAIWFGTDELDGVDLHLARHVTELDLTARRARDDRGDEYGFERLILATGGTPRRLPSDDESGAVVYYRTVDDYRRLRAAADAGKRFVVVGGGFIGSEIAAALAMNGRQVTYVVAGPQIGSRLVPPDLARFVTEYYREQGVDVLTGARVTAIGRVVRLEDGRTLEADVVIAGLGIEPNVEIAGAAGLAVEDGIVVDDYARAAGREDVFAAGDVARFPEPVLGLTRVEHEDHARTHGKLAGRNAAGAGERYDHLPFFYSDLFDLGYEAVGELDGAGATVETWSDPGRKGVIAYADDTGRPRGFLLWGIFGKVDDARALIRGDEPIDEKSLGPLLG